jgi:hypothetical protein
MNYHITITNNETGETLLDRNTDCIILAVDTEKKTSGALLCNCDPLTVATTIRVVKRAIEDNLTENPEIAGALAMIEAYEHSKKKAQEG